MNLGHNKGGNVPVSDEGQSWVGNSYILNEGLEYQSTVSEESKMTNNACNHRVAFYTFALVF